MEEQGDKEPVVIIWHVNFPVARLMVTCTNLWSLEVEDLVVGEALVCFNTLMFVSLLKNSLTNFEKVHLPKHHCWKDRFQLT
jgi:hypothetical protein